MFNKHSIRRHKMFHRIKKYEKIKVRFQSNITFDNHWDGKLIYDWTGKEKFIDSQY